MVATLGHLFFCLLGNFLRICPTIGPRHLHGLLHTPTPLTLGLTFPPLGLHLPLPLHLDPIELTRSHVLNVTGGIVVRGLDFLARHFDFLLDGMDGDGLFLRIGPFVVDEFLVGECPLAGWPLGGTAVFVLGGHDIIVAIRRGTHDVRRHLGDELILEPQTKVLRHIFRIQHLRRIPAIIEHFSAGMVVVLRELSEGTFLALDVPGGNLEAIFDFDDFGADGTDEIAVYLGFVAEVEGAVEGVVGSGGSDVLLGGGRDLLRGVIVPHDGDGCS
mmetsp:Transcript_4621/g.8207  ORF Transcript_4621/g.8207 Transcript_4621/m.8207 type:complete len:273 (-) Transcript_4621:137-955(-)